MMASALLRAGAVLDDDWARAMRLDTLEPLRAARVAADAVAHTPGGIGGLLDDQVQTAAAALDGVRGHRRARMARLGRGDHGSGLGGTLGR